MSIGISMKYIKNLHQITNISHFNQFIVKLPVIYFNNVGHNKRINEKIINVIVINILIVFDFKTFWVIDSVRIIHAENKNGRIYLYISVVCQSENSQTHQAFPTSDDINR